MTSFRLTIELPYTLRLPDGEYICRLGKDGFTVGTELVAQLAGDPQKDCSYVVAPATGEVMHAGSGIEIPGAGSRRTRVTIQFSFQSPTSEEPSERTKEKARGFLSAFLDSYRHMFNEPRVYALSPAEFYAVRHNLAPRFMVETRDETGHGKRAMGVTFGDQPLVARSASHYPDEDVHRFRCFVGQNAEPQLVDVLVLNAKGYLSDGRYRLAVIEAGTALDVSVEDGARLVLASPGESTDDSLRDLEKLTAKSIAERFLQGSFTASDDWKVYDRELRPLRNSVVHDAFGPSKDQTEKFLSTVERLIQRLRTGVRG